MKYSKGFTLIEFIAVIIAIGILATAVSTSWPTKTNKLILNSQATALMNDIRYTQQLSMTRGERYRLVITPATNAYKILNSAGTAITMPTGNATVTLKSGITFGALTYLPNNLIVFDCQGIPYTNTVASHGGTLLGNTATIPLTAGSLTKTVSISPETGRVTVT